jgi:molybdopterin-guanine dinucleotide biosynthesis protein
MAIVVVGGHTRNVGKTSVVAGLIAALPEFHWAAMKITQHGHGICAADGHACHCATDDHAWAISKETDRTGKSDTSRFLLAGAEPVWWARTEQGRLAEAMPAIRERIARVGNVIVESNSVLKFLRPDLYLTVLDPATADFKASAREFLDRADAVVLHGQSKRGVPEWNSVSLRQIANRPTFIIRPPDYVPEELVQFVRSSLAGKGVS